MTTLRIMAWAIWLLASAVSVGGLVRLRIDNQLDNWAPDLQAVGPYPSYLVVGWERSQADRFEVAQRLRGVPQVALCVDSTMVATGLAGTTPDRFVISEDGQYLGAFCFRSANVTDHALVECVQAALAERFPTTRFAIAGPAVYHVAMDRYSQNRLPEILAAVTAVGFVLLWWLTGGFRSAAITVVALGMSQAIVLGAWGWAGRSLDLSAAMAPPLMMSLGFSYAAHRMLGIRKTSVLAICAIVAVTGIGAFAVGQSSPLRSFATLGVAGLVTVWLAVMTLVRPIPRESRPRRVWLRPVLSRAIYVATHHSVFVRWFAVACVLGGVFACGHLRYALDPMAYFPAGSRERTDFETLDRRLTGMLPFQLVTRPSADASAVLSQSPGVRKTIDISWMLRDGNRTYWCLADNGALAQLIHQAPAWKAWGASHGVALQWRGVAAQVGQAHIKARRDVLESLPAMLILTALATAAIARRFIAAAIGAWICIVPILTMAVIASVTRQAIDLPAMMIAAITVGVTVDDTLHLLTAYLRRRDIKRTMIEQWRGCAGSSLLAVLTALGFALSPFKPTYQFGMLLGAALLLASVSNQLLLSGVLPYATKSARPPRPACFVPQPQLPAPRPV